jgi:tetratricopeptide (TPR) repeat protein
MTAARSMAPRKRSPNQPTAANISAVRSIVASFALLAACASVVPTVAEAEQALAAAEAANTAQDWDGALAAVAPLEGDACPRRLRDRRDVATATAWRGKGELWEAFQALEKFADDHAHSELRPAVVEMLWDSGQKLTQSERGFLFFWSDKRAGRTVLEHLVTRYPDTIRMADALRILGDMAYLDGDYELAQQRFKDLILNRPDSEWIVYARYQFAMSIVASLRGPDYDLDRMEHAVRELTDFLADKPENPQIVANAEGALAQVREWQLERHRVIARFYRRVGNQSGERRHLEIAASAEFVGIKGQAEAAQALAELPAAPAAAGSPAP